MEVDLTAPLEGLVYEKRDHIAYIRSTVPSGATRCTPA